MASKTTASLALFLVLNLLFFTLIVTACHETCPKPKPKPKPRPRPRPTPSPGAGGTPPTPCTPSTPGTTPSPSGTVTCPRDALKLGICIQALNLLNATIGAPPVQPCCTLIQGLADLEAAVCLCTAIRGSILGLNLNLPINLSLLINVCGGKVPRGFQCP